MKIFNLFIVFGLIFGWNNVGHAEDEFGLDEAAVEAGDNVSIPEVNAEVENAGQDSAVLDELPPTNDEIATADEVKADDAVQEVETENPVIETPSEEIQEKPENISYYIKKLDLSEKQLDEAKFISDEMIMRQEQLQKSVMLLKSQAKEIEMQSLKEFEAILTPEQLATFRKIYHMKNF